MEKFGNSNHILVPSFLPSAVVFKHSPLWNVLYLNEKQQFTHRSLVETTRKATELCSLTFFQRLLLFGHLSFLPKATFSNLSSVKPKTGTRSLQVEMVPKGFPSFHVSDMTCLYSAGPLQLLGFSFGRHLLLAKRPSSSSLYTVGRSTGVAANGQTGRPPLHRYTSWWPCWESVWQGVWWGRGTAPGNPPLWARSAEFGRRSGICSPLLVALCGWPLQFESGAMTLGLVL